MKIVLCTALSGACARARTQRKGKRRRRLERVTNGKRAHAVARRETSVFCHLSTIAGGRRLSDRSIEKGE